MPMAPPSDAGAALERVRALCRVLPNAAVGFSHRHLQAMGRHDAPAEQGSDMNIAIAQFP
jgi:hypothetical protein